ncbi:redoxin domain-containing protein [bacterium]|nr:MAG: redoxin domain-containing protein [bacterium]
MRFSSALFALAAVSSIAGAAETKKLAPGAPAPELSIKKWLKGTPIKALAKNKTYVIEFWATWCGPCVAAMPHLSELAKKNKDVTFLGVGIWEQDKGGNLKKFVDGMGGKMAYNVGYSGHQDGMAATWMEPFSQNGIPASFVVKNGKVMWIGHPMDLEKPLAQIKAGKFDLKGFQAKFKAQAQEEQVRQEGYRAVLAARKLFDAGKRDEAKAALTKAEAAYPKSASLIDGARFDWLAVEDVTAWEAKAEEYAASKDSEKIERVSSFAMSNIDTPGRKELALKAIAIAVKGSEGREFFTLFYASMIYEKSGDAQLGLDATKKALALLPSVGFPDDKEIRAELTKRQKGFEEKLAKAG